MIILLAIAAGVLVGMGAVLWAAAVLAVVLSGGGWHPGSGGEAGAFLAEILTGATPSAAWKAATPGRSVFLPTWVFWTIVAVLTSVLGGAAWFAVSYTHLTL